MQTTRVILTPALLDKLIGQEISWFSYGYSSNMPSSGRCKILGHEPDPRFKNRETHPIVAHIAGDKLEWAWCNNNGRGDDYYTYGDDGRPVYIGEEFKRYVVEWEVPKFDYTYANGNPMQYGIIVYNGQDVQTIARSTTSAKEFRVREFTTFI